MNIKILGRYADQPLLLNKLHKKIPSLLITLGGAYGIYDTYKSSKGKSKEFKKNKLIKNSIIISSTAAASLAGANGLKMFGKQIIPRLIPACSKKEILQKQSLAINDFLKKSCIKDRSILEILNNAKKRALKPSEAEKLIRDIPQSNLKNKLFETILPEPENLNAKDIFSEIGRLSLLGALPVVGGVLGGVAADRVTKTSSQNSTANKIKEGFYQYFANIFLCNVGACVALFAAEFLQKLKAIKPLSPAKKMVVILSGITTTGIIGGSWIANKMSQKVIDPLFNNNSKISLKKRVYDERKPELADIALHSDDIATAGVLSGFKWIEPALPLMYFVSGYRAGIGYRNNNKNSNAALS